MANFDCVIFDFDGTVADTGEGLFEGIRYAIRMEGLEQPTDAEMRKFVGPPLPESFKRQFPNISDEQVNRLIIHYRAKYSVDGYYKFRLYDGMENLLETLRSEGIKTGIGSSKPQMFLDHILKTCDLAKFFDAPVGADSDETASKKDIIEKSASILNEKYGCTRPLMVGDTKFDIIGARQAGVPSVGVTFGYGKVEELLVHGADYLADSCEDIKRIVMG